MAYSTITKPGLYFNTNLYTGNDADNRGITGIGFQPDWVWLKKRNATAGGAIFDAVRGAGKVIYPSETNAEGTETASFVSFDSDGYTISQDAGVGLNVNNDTYVGWNWKAGTGQGSSNTDGSINTTYTSVNTTAGFSIIKYTGTGSVGTIGHGLGAKPNVIIQKKLSGTAAWTVYHDKVDANPSHKYLYLDKTDALADYTDHWNDTEPTSSLITLGTDTAVNGSGATNIIYAFTEKAGYSKFGKYTGNGNADGTFVYLGFKPAWIMVKRTDATQNWVIYDSTRDSFNVADARLRANLSNAEGTQTGGDFLSNGFKLRDTNDDKNVSGGSYIYMAFAEEPLVANVGSSIPATAR